jgi:hypothetical protein
MNDGYDICRDAGCFLDILIAGLGNRRYQSVRYRIDLR